MKPEARIDVRGIVLGDSREIRHAGRVLAELFHGDREAFRVYFGLKPDCEAMQAIR